jgi:hypothetical protein
MQGSQVRFITRNSAAKASKVSRMYDDELLDDVLDLEGFLLVARGLMVIPTQIQYRAGALARSRAPSPR